MALWHEFDLLGRTKIQVVSQGRATLVLRLTSVRRAELEEQRLHLRCECAICPLGWYSYQALRHILRISRKVWHLVSNKLMDAHRPASRAAHVPACQYRVIAQGTCFLGPSGVVTDAGVKRLSRVPPFHERQRWLASQ